MKLKSQGCKSVACDCLGARSWRRRGQSEGRSRLGMMCLMSIPGTVRVSHARICRARPTWDGVTLWQLARRLVLGLSTTYRACAQTKSRAHGKFGSEHGPNTCRSSFRGIDRTAFQKLNMDIRVVIRQFRNSDLVRAFA